MRKLLKFPIIALFFSLLLTSCGGNSVHYTVYIEKPYSESVGSVTLHVKEYNNENKLIEDTPYTISEDYEAINGKTSFSTAKVKFYVETTEKNGELYSLYSGWVREVFYTDNGRPIEIQVGYLGRLSSNEPL